MFYIYANNFCKCLSDVYQICLCKCILPAARASPLHAAILCFCSVIAGQTMVWAISHLLPIKLKFQWAILSKFNIAIWHSSCLAVWCKCIKFCSDIKLIYFQVITKDSVCLCISDGSLLPLMAAKLGAKKVNKPHIFTAEIVINITHII